jgi:ADP-heptose:LPS heptosyltransferase
MPQGARRLLSAAYFYWKHLRKRHFDVAMSPRWDVDEHLATLLCLLANADGRVGYGEEASASKQAINRGFSAAFSHCIPAGGIRHEVWRNLAIVEAIAGPVASPSLEIHLTERDRRHAGRILQDAPDCSKWIAMGIGARSPGRRWPVERYAEVVTQLAKVYAVHAILLCSAAEHEDARALASLLGRNHTIVSGGQLREVGAVLERCDLFLGNDSGCAHLAAATNCPAIVISRHPGDGDPNHFNSPVRFAPHGSRVKVLQPVTGLAPCTTACRSLKPHCITTVSVDAVVAASLQMLRETQLQSPPTLPSLSSEYAARHLLDVHSPAAVRRAVEALLVDREHVEMPS